MPFGNSGAESQRDSGSKPRVARNELPWETWPKENNPNGVAAQKRRSGTTPSWLGSMRPGNQGSSCLATLPFLTMQKSALSIPLSALLGALLLAQPCSSAPRPLINAHAHNDYEHPRPLLDALDHGFCSVEADIYLVEGQLLVAHNRSDVSKERRDRNSGKSGITAGGRCEITSSWHQRHDVRVDHP